MNQLATDLVPYLPLFKSLFIYWFGYRFYCYIYFCYLHDDRYSTSNEKGLIKYGLSYSFIFYA